jgi:hypothetical protein
LIAQPRKASLFVGARAVYLARRLVSINSKSKTATVCATVGPHMTNSKAHDIARYDGMRMIEPLVNLDIEAV